MSFDISSLSPALIREILADRKVDLAQLLVFEQFADVRNVVEQEGSLYIWDSPIGIPTDEAMTSEVDPDADTPQGPASLGTRGYACPDYRFAMRINRMAEQSLSTLGDAIDKLVMRSAVKVLGDYNRQIANVLTAGGAALTNDDVTAKVVANAWNGASGTPLDDIDSVIDVLGTGLDVVMGANVATVLSRDPQITGSAAGSGREFVGYAALRQALMDRGCGRVFIIGAHEHVGELDAVRSYGHLYKDVFAMSVPGNLVVPRFLPLEETLEHDQLNKRKFFVAEHSHDIIT